jgi:hypothetical protein
MAQRVDDPSIKDEDWLWRRIPNRPQWYAQNPDGSYRVSSVACLDDYTGEVSVDQAKPTTLEQSLRPDPDDGLVQVQASILRANRHIVVADPILDPDPVKYNPAHALICPQSDLSKGQRKTSARTMAKVADWLVMPKALRDE